MEIRPIIAWVAIAAALIAVTLTLRLPERMGCANGVSRYVRCQHSLLSPETWRPR